MKFIIPQGRAHDIEFLLSTLDKQLHALNADYEISSADTPHIVVLSTFIEILNVLLRDAKTDGKTTG